MARQLEDMDIEEKLNEIEETADELYDFYRENRRMHLWSLSVNVLRLVVVCLSPFKKLSSYLTCINYVGISAMFFRALYQCRKQYKISEKKRKCEETLEDVYVMMKNGFGISYKDGNFGSDEYHEVNPGRRVPSTDIPGKNNWLLVMGQQILNVYSLIFLKQPVHFRLRILDDVRKASRFCNCIIDLTETIQFKQLKGLLLKYTTSKEDLTKAVENVNMRSYVVVGHLFIQKGRAESNLKHSLIKVESLVSACELPLYPDFLTMKKKISAFNHENNTIIQSAKQCLDIAEVQSDIYSSEDVFILAELGQNFATNGSGLLENLHNIHTQLGSLQKAANVDMAIKPAEKEKLVSDLTVLLENVTQALSIAFNLKQWSIQLNAQNASRLRLNQWTTKLSALNVDKFSVKSATERAIKHIMEVESKRSAICESISLSRTECINLKWIPLWRDAVQRFESLYKTLKMTMCAIIEGTEAVENACESLDNLSVDTIDNHLTAMAEETMKIYSKTTMEINKYDYMEALTTSQSGEPEPSLSEALLTMSKTAKEVAQQIQKIDNRGQSEAMRLKDSVERIRQSDKFRIRMME